jgi:sugar lactone lactonase YvrE
MNGDAHAFEAVTESIDILGESPVWCEREQALFWVDIRAPAVCRLDAAGGTEQRFILPDLCGGVALSGDARLVLALRTGLAAFERATDRVDPVLQPEPEALGNRLNEARCDRRGRLWVGTMRDYGAATTGSLYRVLADLRCDRMLETITVPNAFCWSPDDRTMYFADTPDGRLRAYAFDPEAGRLGAMRVLVDAGVLPGRPDGAAVDADGCIWTARYEGACVARVTPDGRVDRVLDVPATRVTACTFGGPDLRTLYVTTARQKLSAEQLAAQPLAGAVFAARVATPGLPEPRFALPA